MTARRAVAAWLSAAAVAATAATLLLHATADGPARAEPPLSSAASTAEPAAGAAVDLSRGPVSGGGKAAAKPVRLQIPTIGVDSTLLSLGLTPDGSLEVPARGPDYDRAGWYQYSPTPGSTGPAVIVGHVDSARTGPSVFYRLGSLHSGDQVLVTGADHTLVTFTVTRLLRVAKTAFPTQLVYGDTPASELRLITCGGRLDAGTGHYEDNIIVMATRSS